jgi:hypothetical protein
MPRTLKNATGHLAGCDKAGEAADALEEKCGQELERKSRSYAIPGLLLLIIN